MVSDVSRAVYFFITRALDEIKERVSDSDYTTFGFFFVFVANREADLSE